MSTQNNLNSDKIILDDILRMKDQLVTHYCLVNNEELKNKIKERGISELDIKVNSYIPKDSIILVSKEMFNII